MGKINDIIRDSNTEIIQSHNKHDDNKQFGTAEGEFMYHNKVGYPVYNIGGKKLVPLGFYVSEQKFAEYYSIAKEIAERGMRTPTGNERLLNSPDLNVLLHYSLDFFINNYKISKNMKMKDIMALGKMMIKDLPQMMK